MTEGQARELLRRAQAAALRAGQPIPESLQQAKTLCREREALRRKNDPRRISCDPVDSAAFALKMAQAAARRRGEPEPQNIEEVIASRRKRKRNAARLKKQRRQRQRAKESGKRGVLYFIRCADWIRIGWSSQWEKRRECYEVNCAPHSVILVVPDMTTGDEHDWHDRFRDARVSPRRRSWYHAVPDLLRAIESLQWKDPSESAVESEQLKRSVVAS